MSLDNQSIVALLFRGEVHIPVKGSQSFTDTYNDSKSATCERCNQTITCFWLDDTDRYGWSSWKAEDGKTLCK